MTAFKLTPGLWLVLDVLAVYRLTILITRDAITERLRKWVRKHMGDKAFLFITCPWCTSMWIAMGVVVLTALAPNQWKYVAAVLTLSAGAGFLAEHT